MKTMIRVIAKETGFLKGRLIKAGELFEVNNAKEVPAWAVKVDKNGEPKETPKAPEKVDEVVTPAEVTDAEGQEVVENEEPEQDAVVEDDELDKLSDKEVEEIYSDLVDKLVEQNLIIEDAEKKTMVEQIREARKLLAPAEVKEK